MGNYGAGTLAYRCSSQFRTHVLKTWPQFIDPIGYGQKTFELRYNDRQFCIGDMLDLREWNPDTEKWGPRHIVCQITYILDSYEAGRIKGGLTPGFVILGIRLPANHVWPPEIEKGQSGE